MGLINFGIMLLSKRVYLFVYCKRPMPDFEDLIYRMYLWVCLGPLFLAVGNFIFSILSN